MKNHICKNTKFCTCSSIGLEPDEDCFIHGIPKKPRCIHCGRYMKKSLLEKND